MSDQCIFTLPDSTQCSAPATTPAGHCRTHHLDIRERRLASREAATNARENSLDTRESAALKDLEARIRARDAELTSLHRNHTRKLIKLRRAHAEEMDGLRHQQALYVRELEKEIMNAKMAAGLREGERDKAQAKVAVFEAMMKEAANILGTHKEGTKRKVEEDGDSEEEEEKEERGAKRVKFGDFRDGRSDADDEGDGGSGSDDQAQGEPSTSCGEGGASEIQNKLGSMSLGR
ncbi:hypothetical protein UCDDS831_g02014 [Diplodia seriata]|uniref:Uncharacterized protein n=1 Tax=Diplodia seriata TaxID=420778 RepID=A0A0G2EU54_9PEZI|nr:hypothetical protein UCDDS831_g02014 [Diplodia seriata]